MKPRNTVAEKMEFYKDIGAWQVFRQCNYRKGFNYGTIFAPYIRNNISIVEYGCGIAPLTNYIIERPQEFLNVDISTLKFNMVDVGGEHLNFAKWRLNKKFPQGNFRFYEITPENIVPFFDCNLDIICIMDVLEHLPNPYDVMSVLAKYSNPGAVLVETWVDKSGGQAGGPDLEEAEQQRKITMDLIAANYSPIKAGSIRSHRKSQ